jgi:hypothetical protein
MRNSSLYLASNSSAETQSKPPRVSLFCFFIFSICISNMSQPTCHFSFLLHSPTFHTDRTFFLPKIPVFRCSLWCTTTTVQTTNGRSECWEDSGCLPPASTPWRSSGASTTSHRPLHTWSIGPTMPRNQTTQWCAVPTMSSGARENTSFSCPCASRRQVRFGSPVRGGGGWRTSSGNTPLFCRMHSVPQGVRAVSFHNGNGPFGYLRH